MDAGSVEKRLDRIARMLEKDEPAKALEELRQIQVNQVENPPKTESRMHVLGGASFLARSKNAETRKDRSSDLRNARRHYLHALKLDDGVDGAKSGLSSTESEMDHHGIRTTLIPRIISNQTPTVWGLIMLPILLIALMYGLSLIKGQTSIRVELDSNAAPLHVQNFKAHVEAGNYDNVVFHRIIDEFMIQTGDYERGDGTGGAAAEWFGYCNGVQSADSSACTSAEWTVPDEATNGLIHEPGALSMAKTSAPHTGGSQFFIVDRGSNPSHLDGVHTVFGRVVGGTIDGAELSDVEGAMDLVDQISQAPVDGDSPAGDPPRITKATIDPDNPNIVILVLDIP